MSLSPAKPNHRRHSLAVAVLGLASLTFSGGRAVDAGDKPGAAPAKKLSQEEEALALKVNAAIDRGQKWFISTQTADGFWVKDLGGRQVKVSYGEQSLILFSLVKSGLSTKDECVKKGLKALDFALKELGGKTLSSGLKVYEASCVLLLYSALYDQRKTMPGGAVVVEKRMKELVTFLQSTQRDGGWRYPSDIGGGPQDLSNTQYALYGIHMAASCGIPVKPEVFKRALDSVLAQQKKNGPEVDYYSENPTGGTEDGYSQWRKGTVSARGWGYLPSSGETGSMTTAGISTLALIQERLAEAKLLTDEDRLAINSGILKGLASLSNNFSVETNPKGGDRRWLYYYLYGLERTGSFLDLKHVGQVNWYSRGAEFLLKQQRDNGSWGLNKNEPSETTDQHNTAFGLLFLARKSPKTHYKAPVVTESAEATPAPDPREEKPEAPENNSGDK